MKFLYALTMTVGGALVAAVIAGVLYVLTR
jgi:hypothetical protein